MGPFFCFCSVIPGSERNASVNGDLYCNVRRFAPRLVDPRCLSIAARCRGDDEGYFLKILNKSIGMGSRVVLPLALTNSPMVPR